MDVKQIIYKTQDSYNEFCRLLENTVRNLAILLKIEDKQLIDIAEYQEKIKAQHLIISKFKPKNALKADIISKVLSPIQNKAISIPNSTQEIKETSMLANSLSSSIKITEKIPEENIRVNVSLKRKIEPSQISSNKMKKTQKTMDSYFSGSINPNLLKKDINLIDKRNVNSLNDRTQINNPNINYNTTISAVIDSEGFRILNKNKKIDLKIDKNAEITQKSLPCNTIKASQEKKTGDFHCNKCKEIHEKLGEVLEKHDIQSLCSEHYYDSKLAKVPEFYFK